MYISKQRFTCRIKVTQSYPSLAPLGCMIKWHVISSQHDKPNVLLYCVPLMSVTKYTIRGYYLSIYCDVTFSLTIVFKIRESMTSQWMWCHKGTCVCDWFKSDCDVRVTDRQKHTSRFWLITFESPSHQGARGLRPRAPWCSGKHYVVQIYIPDACLPWVSATDPILPFSIFQL